MVAWPEAGNTEVLRRGCGQPGLKAYLRCTVLRQVRYEARWALIRFDLVSELNCSLLFRAATSVDVSGYGGDLGRNGATEIREGSGGGRSDQATGNRVLHHRQTFLVSQKRE